MITPGGTLSVMPLRVWMWMGLPPALAFREEPPGSVETTVVHGFVLGLGARAQPTMGAPIRSVSHTTGDPPAMTVVCFGMSVTLPPWTHMMVALTLTSGGIRASLGSPAETCCGCGEMRPPSI